MAEDEARPGSSEGNDLSGVDFSGEVNINQVLKMLSTQVISLQTKTAATAELEKTRRELQELNDAFEHQGKMQEQKDEAQDNLLEMQFDTVKREMATFIRGKDMEDQKAFLLSKLSNIEIEMRDAMRSLGASLREEVNSDSKKLQQQMEQISNSVASQIKLVDDRLKSNSESDQKFAEAVLARLSRVEQELGIDENGNGSGDGGVNGRFRRLEEKIDALESNMKLNSARSADDLKELLSKLEDTELTKQLEARVTALELRCEELARKDAEIVEEVEVVRQEVEETKRSNKLDWLEMRVKELADKRAGVKPDPLKMVNELTSRVTVLEEGSQQLEATLKDQLQASMEMSQKSLRDDVSESSDEGGGGGGRKGAGNSAFDVNNPELSYVNLFEDMERLRCIIECMEDSMPLEVRRAISFFKRGRGKGNKSGRRKSDDAGGKLRSASPAPLELEAEVLGLRSETEEQAQRVQRVEEMLENERVNLHKAMRGCEREQDHIKAKVEDLWRQLPQVSAILAPLQVSLIPDAKQEGENTENTDGAGPAFEVKAETAIEALKPLGGLIEAALQKSIDKLREDLLQGIHEVKGEVGLKASANDLSLLKDRMERWARSPSPPPRLSLASYKGKALERPSALEVPDGWASQSLDRPPGGVARSKCGGTCHEKCKHTTDPCAQSQSTGRLPALNRTR